MIMSNRTRRDRSMRARRSRLRDLNLPGMALAVVCAATALPCYAQGTPPPGGQAPPVSSAPPWALRRDGTAVPEWQEPGSPKPKTPPPPGLYVAIGDSITFGYGTTRDCQSFPAHPVDIEAFCPSGTSYAALVAKGVRKTGIAGSFMNLGISGADLRRVLRDELPLLPAEATLVTLYIGTNDSRGAASSSVEGVVKRFETRFEDVLTAIHSKAPKARIVLINFPNERVLAEELFSTYHTAPEALPKFEVVSGQLAAFIDSHYPQYPVVDTVCMPESYRTDLLYRMSVHPNDEGSRILAKAVLKVITSATPPGPPNSCKWLSEKATPPQTK